MSGSRGSNAGLIKAAQAGDSSACEKVIEANMALVFSIARRYEGRAELEDLVQIGSLGLLKAVRRFDVSLGLCFSTYAVPVIAGEIKRFLRDDGPVKVSRRLKETAAAISRLNSRKLKETGRSATADELCRELMLDGSDIAAAMEAGLPCLSLEGLAEDGSGGDIPDGEGMEAEAVDRLLIAELLRRLAPAERAVIVGRFFADMTQRETGAALGLSQAQVSRIESRAIKAMRSSAGV